MSNASSTLGLLEQCLPIFEDRYMICPHELWCFITMYASFMMLKIHLGKETWQTAKSSCAQRFLSLYFKQAGRMQLAPGEVMAHIDVSKMLPVSVQS